MLKGLESYLKKYIPWREYDHSQNYINPSLSPQGDNSVTPKTTREASYTILSEKAYDMFA